jgi:hypothetical protein
MPDLKPERRSQKRVPARLPVSIRTRGSAETIGHTRDLSMSGIFLYTESKIEAGSVLEMVLILPPELTQGEKRWMCCQASVLRVEASTEGGGRFGVAANIERIELLPELAGFG